MVPQSGNAGDARRRAAFLEPTLMRR